jgi:hypothetical protein
MKTPGLDAVRRRVRTPALDAVSRRVRARDTDPEPEYGRTIKSRGGIEMVKAMMDDPNYSEGDFAVNGPGGWLRFTSRSEAEKHYNWLVSEYAS